VDVLTPLPAALYGGRASGFEEGHVLPGSNDALPAYRGGFLEDRSRLNELAKRDDVVRVALDLAWGVKSQLGRNFGCVLPGHADHASMYHDPQSGVWKLRCWCRDEWWTLAEARAARGYGKPRSLKNAEAAVWYRRLWHDAGLIVPRPLGLPPSPRAMTPSGLRVLQGFELLVGLRWLTHEGQAVTYTRDFAAAWCGVSAGTAQAAISLAVATGVIVVVDTCKIGAHPARLFLPGSFSALKKGTL
jgi:hypothetical protein